MLNISQTKLLCNMKPAQNEQESEYLHSVQLLSRFFVIFMENSMQESEIIETALPIRIPLKRAGLNPDQLILAGAEAHFFRMFNETVPVCGGMGGMEMIFIGIAVNPAPGHCWLRIAQIRTGRIQSHRIKGSQHADIRNDRHIVLRVASRRTERHHR